MTFQIGLVLAILGIAVVLFITEKLRVDVVALMVLVLLALTGLVSPQEALSGFSNPAVVTVWAVFILSGGLTRTGVAGLVGRQVLRLAGSGEMRLIALIMLTVGIPVGVHEQRRRGGAAAAGGDGHRPPHRPVAVEAADPAGLQLAARRADHPDRHAAQPARSRRRSTRRGSSRSTLFDFAPVGVAVVLAGIAYMAFVGRRLLPARTPTVEGAATRTSRTPTRSRTAVRGAACPRTRRWSARPWRRAASGRPSG